MNDDFQSITVKYKSYFKINNSDSEEINLEDIDVNVSTNNSENQQLKQSKAEPNFLALTVFWAYFSACQQGMINLNSPVPWRKFENEEDFEVGGNDFDYEVWFKFLNNIVDSNWSEWIKDPQKIKKRALSAYENEKLKHIAMRSLQKKTMLKEKSLNKIKDF
ncbi:MAG: hypothetical protein ACQERJ_04015, partial [Bacillota bacterium]